MYNGHDPRETLVERPENPRFPVRRFQQQRAQGGRQRQRHHAGNDHRRDDGDGELLVEPAGEAAEKGHRDEHRAQHQLDRDDGAGHLAHGLDRRFLGREALLGHEPLDVLQHDDGVVHDDARGEHDREQRQRVDREAERVQAGETTR